MTENRTLQSHQLLGDLTEKRSLCFSGVVTGAS